MTRHRSILPVSPMAMRDEENNTRQRSRDDAELFACHLAGEHDALMELFDRHNQRIYLYCVKITGDRQQGLDLTQEVWEKVIRMRSQDSVPPRKPLGLLLTMARNLSLNHIRAQRKLKSIDDLQESDHPQTRIHERSHLEELVVMALRKLPTIQQEILILNAYSGYGFDEIAEILGKKVGAIHTTAWRARTRLANIIATMMERDIPAGSNDDRGNDETENNR